ncbi:MAG: tetratricopeptide repeat protein [Chloroflexota bacterium]
MAALELNLLASFQVTLNGRILTQFATDKVRALLAYLAVERQHPHRRESLAALLWPDQPDKQARHNLRQALSNLRQVLQDHDDERAFLLIDRHDVWLNPQASIQVDVADFATLSAACAGHRHRQPDVCLPCLQRQTEMVALYRGDFLAGFSPADSTPFEEWTLLKREWLHRQVIDALTLLADYAERRGDVDAARRYARQQVALEPWREEAHRQLIRLLAQSGQRSAALAQYAACRQAMAQELGALPAAETERLYQLINHDGLPPLLTPPANLPQPPSPFSGRVQERAALAELLAAPDSRLITLIGPGGIGKSRLALQVAEDQRGLYADGLFWADLSAVQDAAQIVPTLAHSLQLALHRHGSPPQQLRNYLRRKRLLLVLDGVEHLPDLARLLATLLSDTPQVLFLVTSRHRLGLQEELLFTLAGLAHPKTAVSPHLPSGSSAEQHEAVTFLRQQIERLARSFQPSAADHKALVAICHLVEGMPLALELAAAAVAEQGCAAVAQSLHSSLDLLTSPLHNVPARQRSMRATFAHSWTLLTAAERRRLARLAIFHGSFAAAAGQEIAGAAPATMERLLARSLLHWPENGRYQLHTLLRQFAIEKLDERADDKAETAVRHATHYTHLLAAQEERLQGHGQEDALLAIDREIGNVRQAWQWAIIHLAERPLARDLLNRSLASLCHYYCLRSWYHEGAALFAQAVAALQTIAPQDDLLLGRLLARQARCQEFTAPAAEASQLYRQSLAILRRSSAAREAALPLYGLGYMAHLQGDYDTACRHFHESLAHYEQAQDRWGMATTLSGLCLNRRRQGDFAGARQAGTQSLTIRRAIGDRRGVASSQNNLGLILCDLGEYEAAEVALLESVAICRALGHPIGTANACTGLVQVAMQQGDTDGARRYQEEARQLYQQVGDVWGVAIAYNNLGEISLKSGEPAAACALFSQALAAYRQADVPGGQAGALSNWGQACLLMGDLPGASRYFAEGLHIALAIGDRPVALEILVRTAVLWQQTESAYHPLVLLMFALRQPELLAETRQMATAAAAALRSASAPEQAVAAEKEAAALDWQAIDNRYLSHKTED